MLFAPGAFDLSFVHTGARSGDARSTSRVKTVAGTALSVSYVLFVHKE